MPSFSESVFINCPFTPNFKPLFDAMVFTTIGCGFTPRCTKEINDVDDIRIIKIMNLIRECQYGIHDVSLANGRLNMPLELGLFMGCKEYGGKTQAGKRCIVFEEKDYKSKVYLSDLGGQDMMAHNKNPNTIIKKVREWLAPKAPHPDKSRIHLISFKIILISRHFFQRIARPNTGTLKKFRLTSICYPYLTGS